jgi:hypothetical protein
MRSCNREGKILVLLWRVVVMVLLAGGGGGFLC